MHLHKDAIASHRHRRPYQRQNKLPLTRRPIASTTRQLHAMGGIKDHLGELGHDHQTPEIHHQVVVSKGYAPLCDVIIHRTTRL